MSKTFNEMFIEATSKDPRARTIEFEGKTLHLGLRVFPEPGVETLIEWEFDSPHPVGEVAIQLSAIRCSFRFTGVDKAETVIGVHGEANRGWIIVDKLGDDPVVLVTNAWLDPRLGDQFEFSFGDQAMLIDETQPGTYVIRANNAVTDDRMAFSDFIATVKVTTLGASAGYEPGYGEIHPDYPIENYRYVDTGGQALSAEGYQAMSFDADDSVVSTDAIAMVTHRWDDVATVLGRGRSFVDLRLNLEDESMSEFGIRDEAKLWGLAAVRLSDGTILEDGTIRYQNPDQPF